MPELEMYFTKAALHADGTMHWAATVTDTDVDNHGERVDKSFFGNAIRNSQEYGLPYVCVSHYDFKGKGIPEERWVAGPTIIMYEDGEKFKAKGTFNDTVLGRTSFAAIQEDIKNRVSHDERTRISQGFYDRTNEEQKSETTEEGNERRVYKDGIIKHFALTRVPVLPRTEVEAWREKSMVSKKEDATSIVGEELAEELENLAKEVGKSETEELVIKADEETVEMAKKKKKKGQPEKVDKDFVYTEQPRGPGGTMAEEMWTETGEEAEYPEMDEATKKKNEEERKRIKKTGKKKSETEEEVTEMMIKDEDGEVVLYSKDGSKSLGRFPYGAGKKYADKGAAMAAAKKREGQVQFFKREKSETEEECDIVGGTLEEEAELTEMAKKPGSFGKMWKDEYGGSVDKCIQMAKGKVKDPGAYCAWMKDKALKTTKWRGKEEKSDVELTEDMLIQEFLNEQSETVEKAGRRLRGKKIEEFRSMRDQMQQIIETADTFLKWAEETPEAITNTSTGVDMPIENPAIAILEQGAPATMVYEADFDDKMQEFAEIVYAGVTEGDYESVQNSLGMIAKAIADELEPSILENVSKAEDEEVIVKAEEVQSPVTPLDAFNMKANAVLESVELDRRGKLAALQDTINEAGGWLQKAVIEGTAPSMGDIREVIVTAVEKGTQSLVQENATLKARLEELERKVDQTGPPQAPIRKSVYASQGVPPKLENGTFTAAEVARRTMPQGVYY